MASESEAAASAGIWTTFSESPLAVKAIFGGVFVNRVGGFLNIFLVLFMTSKGHSPAEAALTLGAYGIGGVLGVLIGGMLADRLGARNATVLSMSSSAVLIASLLYLPNYLLLLAAVGAGGSGQSDLPAGLGHPAVRADAGEPAGDDLCDVPVRAEPGYHRGAVARLCPLQPGQQALHIAVLGRGAGGADLCRAGDRGAASPGTAGGRAGQQRRAGTGADLPPVPRQGRRPAVISRCWPIAGTCCT